MILKMGTTATLAFFGFVISSAAGAAAAANVPHVFAPGVISSTVGADCLTFTPDGNTAIFDREPGRDVMIMVSHRADGRWSMPHIASFSGRWADHDPAMAPDGSYLIFTSNRPDTPGGKPLHGGHLWRVNREGDGWSKPVRLPDTVNFGSHVYAPSIAANGDLYFQSRDNPSRQFHIYRSAWRGGRYQKPVQLHLGPAGAHELDPAVAPDGSFIVFDADFAGQGKPDRLYIAFREGSRWTKPMDLGDAVNRYEPWGSHLGPDGHTLYFTSNAAPRASYPRTPADARGELARARAWDNGVNHIWYVDLTPWLRAYQASPGIKHDNRRNSL